MSENVIKRLSDYQPYPFALHRTELDITLDPTRSIVRATLEFERRAPGDLVLDGGAGVKLRAISINGAPLDASAYQRHEEELVIPAANLPEGRFSFESEVEIDPASNTSCEGLYLSGGMFCTQCEAEGFRHITFYPDRPDVMAPFRVTMRSDMPVLLSNGNPVSQEDGVAVWDDPWPKPCYLFALVAGDLRAVSSAYITREGREVALNVWVRPGDEDRAEFALESLIASMDWDARVYGRDYDLDVFNIVAVDDFNMGAMENKGLNIFNSALVLASPETATDFDYERIEAVIAHEYFHNWTGNRITCRDWFQLCLKEGLTVYRDQQFTSDLRSAAVKRIEDVRNLRARQFREDAGPLAHPPRPDHYREINNFYTATVYEKGAEIIRMLNLLVGEEGYRAAMDLYFSRHDGEAATIEDWIKVFEDATGRDLTQFKRWYTDAGTPVLTMAENWDAAGGTLRLDFTQSTAPTPGQPDKPARLIPIALGLIGADGTELVPTTLCEMTETTQSFSFTDLPERPVVSVLRGFSAPVHLRREPTAASRATLVAHDTDPFTRWQAGQDMMMAVLSGAKDEADPLIDALGGVLRDAEADPAFTALALSLPDDDAVATYLADSGATPDPDAIAQAREDLAVAIARRHEDRFAALYDAMEITGAYSPDAVSQGRRALRMTALAYLSRLDGGARAQALWDQKPNMTEANSALAALIRAGRADGALADLRARFGDNRLVMDKWFRLQPAFAPQDAASIARKLSQDPGFDWKNPNRFRALLGGLAANHAGFHAADGAGYEFTADWLLRMDKVNPQITARMSSAFETWRRYDETRQKAARAALQRIADAPDLSRNLSEMVERMLKG